MTQEMFVATTAGLGGMLGWGFADLFAKKAIDQVGDIVSLVWAHVFGTAVFLVAALVACGSGKPIPVPSDLQTWGLLLFFGGVQGAVYLLVYKGFGKGQVSLLNPLFASFSGLTAILSIAVFGEAVGTSRLLALGVVFSGILLINVDMDALRSRRLTFRNISGLREVALATVLAAAWTILWDRFIGGQAWLAYAFWMYAFMTLALIIVALVTRVRLSISNPGVWKYLILIGLSEAVAYSAISLGYSTTSLTSVVAILSGAFSLPTIFLARTFLDERITVTQTIGGVAIVVGIAWLPFQ